MVIYCVASGCKNEQDYRKIPFHCFPFKRPEILKLWIEAVRRENWTPSKTSRLCGEHFLPNDYKPGFTARLLQPDAVPSVFAHTKYSLPEEAEPSKKIIKLESSEDIHNNEYNIEHIVKIEVPDEIEDQKSHEDIHSEYDIEHTIKLEVPDEIQDPILNEDVLNGDDTDQVVKDEIPYELGDEVFSEEVHEVDIKPVIGIDASTSINTQVQVQSFTDRETQTASCNNEISLLRRKVKTLTQKLRRRDMTISKLKKITNEVLKSGNTNEKLEEFPKEHDQGLPLEIELFEETEDEGVHLP